MLNQSYIFNKRFAFTRQLLFEEYFHFLLIFIKLVLHYNNFQIKSVSQLSVHLQN